MSLQENPGSEMLRLAYCSTGLPASVTIQSSSPVTSTSLRRFQRIPYLQTLSTGGNSASKPEPLPRHGQIVTATACPTCRWAKKQHAHTTREGSITCFSREEWDCVAS